MAQQVDGRSASSTLQRIENAGTSANSVWKNLSVANRKALLDELQPSFYTGTYTGKEPIELISVQYVPAAGLSVQGIPGGGASPEGAGGSYYLTNVRSVGEVRRFIDSVSGNGPSTLSMSFTRSASNTYSANVGVTAQVVTAGVGFDVSKTRSVNYSQSVNVPSGQRWQIDARNRFNRKSYDVWWDPWIGSNSYKGSGTADDYFGVFYYTWKVY